MIKLSQSELYTYNPDFVSTMKTAMPLVTGGRGLIPPQKLTQFGDLKDYAKRSSTSSPLIIDAIQRYEETKDIMLFDLNVATNGTNGSIIPPFIPFIAGVGSVDADGNHIASKPRIYVNLYRLGFWSADNSSYDDVAVLTDLQSCLETGLIAYRMIVEDKADDVLNNSVVKMKLTNIYVNLFYKALIAVQKYPLSDFQLEVCRYLTAKFFMIYCLQDQPDDPTVQKYAVLIAQQGKPGGSDADSYAAFEGNIRMDYSSVSGFLDSLSGAFFDGKPCSLFDFDTKWVSQYGEGFALCPSYPPYLLHFLFSTIRSARLGGSSRLTGRRDMDFRTEDLRQLYNAVCAACR